MNLLTKVTTHIVEKITLWQRIFGKGFVNSGFIGLSHYWCLLAAMDIQQILSRTLFPRRSRFIGNFGRINLRHCHRAVSVFSAVGCHPQTQS